MFATDKAPPPPVDIPLAYLFRGFFQQRVGAFKLCLRVNPCLLRRAPPRLGLGRALLQRFRLRAVASGAGNAPLLQCSHGVRVRGAEHFLSLGRKLPFAFHLQWQPFYWFWAGSCRVNPLGLAVLTSRTDILARSVVVSSLAMLACASSSSACSCAYERNQTMVCLR